MAQPISSDDVDAYLKSITVAGHFEAGSLRYRLLNYLIRAELNGDGTSLKAYAIGLDVFEKPDTYDPSSDSSVRVTMGRLRTALTLFEANAGQDVPISVNIPVGTYQPIITLRKTETESDRQTPDLSTGPSSNSRKGHSNLRRIVVAMATGALIGAIFVFGFQAWRKVQEQDTDIALEFATFSGEPELAAQLSTSLRRLMSRSNAFTLVSNVHSLEISEGTDFLVTGSVIRSPNGEATVSIELTAIASNSVVWAEAAKFDASDFSQSRIAQLLGNELRVRVYGATRNILAERDPKSLSPEQLFVLATWVPGPGISAIAWEFETIRLMELALEKDSDFGSAHSVLADKKAYLANIDAATDTLEWRASALEHAQLAREYAPSDPDVMFNVAQALWHSGQISNSESTMLRVIELDPSHDLARFLARVIPYTCSVPPDQILQWAKEFDTSLSTNNPIRWLTLSWIAALHANRGEFEEALVIGQQAALMFETPYTFLRRALLLYHLGRTQEAVALIRAHSHNWPNVDTVHFADVTVPRLCSENDPNHRFAVPFRDLADAVANQSELLSE